MTLQEGNEMKTVMSTLLQEASAGQAATTTMKFFVEFADHRGFVGDEVDQTWAFLRENHKQEMAMGLLRYVGALYICTSKYANTTIIMSRLVYE